MKTLHEVVDRLIARANDVSFETWEIEMVQRLRADIATYSWVGFYWVDGDMLQLGAWDGPAATEHTRIAIGDGICGLAARTKESVVVDDVNDHPEYLACFPETRAEIVVPILRNGEAIGEIDIDGDTAGSFSAEDVVELERLAAAVAERAPVGWTGPDAA